MTKISNEVVYIIDNEISDLDIVIGSDGNTLNKQTKNFLLGKMKQYFVSGLSPLTGGTLRFSEIVYNGELYSTPEEVINSLRELSVDNRISWSIIGISSIIWYNLMYQLVI